MLYIIVAILIFGVLIATHELGHFTAAKLLGVRVNEFSIGMGPAIITWERGETQYSIRSFPAGGYCAMEGEDEESDDPAAFQNAAPWKRLIILVAGAAMNFLTGLLLCFLLMIPYQSIAQPVVVGFADGFPLEGESGLMVGDRILSIDGERIYNYSDVGMFFSRSNGETMDLVIKRGNEKIKLDDFPLRLREFVVDGETVMRYGVNFKVAPATLGNKLAEGWSNAIDYVRLVRLSLGDLISGAAGFRDLSGPVGIVGVMSEVGSSAPSVGWGLYNVMYLAALIAVNLAVMNLLPLPALDGGHIFFLLLNGILYATTKKKIAPKYEAFVHMAGLAVLLTLMLMVTLSDVGKLFGR